MEISATLCASARGGTFTNGYINTKTSSSAVAKRPRNASCLSVVSFNSTKRRAESFIVSYVSYRFITVYN